MKPQCTLKPPIKTEHERIQEAYLAMSKKAKYRPAAPSDGVGGIELSDSELADPSRLSDEAIKYATDFMDEEDTRSFFIGVSVYDTNRAFVYTIEAARLLCAGGQSPRAATLLKMALKEIGKREEA